MICGNKDAVYGASKAVCNAFQCGL